jgi:hypothetical protein
MSYISVTIFDPSLRASQPLACALFEAAVGRGALANAYLLTGRDKATKWTLTRKLAAYLNCTDPRRDAAGPCSASAKRCQNCAWIDDDAHPQAWQKLEGEGRSQKVPVEKVRALTDELAKTSPYFRVIVVPDAAENTFHRPAANALLKSIEEPPPNCLFVFFAESVDDVLATIVSRCQVVPVAASLSFGLWHDGEISANGAAQNHLPADEQKHLLYETVRRELGADAARAFKVTGTYDTLRLAHGAMELSQKLSGWFKQLSELGEEGQSAHDLIDLVVASDLEALRTTACSSSSATDYLHKLLRLCEEAKRQIDSYVKPQNAFDYFCFSLHELRRQFSGELSLAKR